MTGSMVAVVVLTSETDIDKIRQKERRGGGRPQNMENNILWGHFDNNTVLRTEKDNIAAKIF